MKVLVLGADGYLGWPTCMYFSQRGHEVVFKHHYLLKETLEGMCRVVVQYAI